MARWLFVILLLVDGVLCGFLVGQRHSGGVAVAGYTFFGPSGALIVHRLPTAHTPAPSFSASMHNQRAAVIAWVDGLPRSLAICLRAAHAALDARRPHGRATVPAIQATCALARRAMDAYPVAAAVASVPAVWTLEADYALLTSALAAARTHAAVSGAKDMLSAVHDALAQLDSGYDAAYDSGY